MSLFIYSMSSTINCCRSPSYPSHVLCLTKPTGRSNSRLLVLSSDGFQARESFPYRERVLESTIVISSQHPDQLYHSPLPEVNSVFLRHSCELSRCVRGSGLCCSSHNIIFFTFLLSPSSSLTVFSCV